MPVHLLPSMRQARALGPAGTSQAALLGGAADSHRLITSSVTQPRASTHCEMEMELVSFRRVGEGHPPYIT